MFDLTPLHTFALKSQCRQLIQINETQDLGQLQTLRKQTPVFLLGGGSNCIFVDDYQGVVAHVNLQGVRIHEDEQAYLVDVAAGENWHQLVELCLHKGIYGLENLALIPGTVGAAPIQNIGAYGIEIERFIAHVDCIELDTGERLRLTPHDCRFGYRDSVFKQSLKDKVLITHVRFSIPKAWQAVTGYAELKSLEQPSAKDIFDKVVEVRQRKLPDPAHLGNAGSFFKNPVISQAHFQQLKLQWPLMPGFELVDDQEQIKVPAAWLIDTLGFKGRQQGQVGCHQKQPLVLVNLGGGTGAELLSLAREIKATVAERFNIQLQHEVNLIGVDGALTL